MSSSHKLSFLFVVAILSIPSIAYKHDNVFKETKMTLHMLDIFGGPNATSVVVSGIAGNRWSFDSFGTTIVKDAPVTEGTGKNSPEIGRVQGVFVTSSLDGSNVQVYSSIAFTSGKRNGSTLELQGRYANCANVSEVSVVGGTGKFRFATGFATFEVLSVEILPAEVVSSVTRCNLTILHY